jgi:class 3 adenylate cyclase
MTPARRLAAILAVEVVGSSHLMGRDKAGRRVEQNGYVRARIIQALKRGPRSGRWLGA